MASRAAQEVRQALAEWRAAKGAEKGASSVPGLFDSEPADPIESVAEHEGPLWRDEALAAVRLAARRHAELTVEDVEWPEALDNRARGWALREAVRQGAIGGTPVYVNARDRSRHGRPVRVWRSLLVSDHEQKGTP